MDGVLFIVYAIGLAIYVLVRKPQEPEICIAEVEDTTREVRLNDAFKYEPNAFMRIAFDNGCGEVEQ